MLLSGNCIGDQGVVKFTDALYHYNCKLTTLDLANCKISPTGNVKVLEAVKYGFSISNLNLD